MKEIREQVSYLQGLAEGLNIDEESKEGKLLYAVIDVLYEMAEQVDMVDVRRRELEEYVEDIDEDLLDLEEDYYGECLDDFDTLELECPQCGQIVTLAGEFPEEEDGQLELVCPDCGALLYDGDEEPYDNDEID